MASLPCTLLIALLFYTHISHAINCGYQTDCGPCTADGTCNLNCATGNNQCQNSLLTCKSKQDCTIDCDDVYGSVCVGATMDASTANNVAIDCQWTESCKNTNVQSGTGNIVITCDQQNSCENMIIDATNANDLQINCWLSNSCKGIDVTCGSGTCFMNCGESVHGQDHCVNMKLKCGTGDCRVSCTDSGYPQCNNIAVNTALANSFTCVGDTSECSAAPEDFTAAPTTHVPTTNVPTTSAPTVSTTSSTTAVPTTNVPTTSHPTTSTTLVPTHRPTTPHPTQNTVSVEIPIIVGNVTNETITDTFTEIIREYLEIDSNGNVSLTVDVIDGKVIVTISTNDPFEIDQTNLIAYVNSHLDGTDIRIAEGVIDIDTTQTYEPIDKSVNNNTGMSGEIIAVMVLIVICFILVLLVAGIIWYKRKMKAIMGRQSFAEKIEMEMTNTDKNRKDTEGGMRSGSIYQTDATGLNNEESLDAIYTEGTGSVYTGDPDEGVNTGNRAPGYEDEDDDDMDILHALNEVTKGGRISNNHSMVIEDSQDRPIGYGIDTVGGGGNEDIVMQSNKSGQMIISTDEEDTPTEEDDTSDSMNMETMC